jgi:hypothetical protein
MAEFKQPAVKRVVKVTRLGRPLLLTPVPAAVAVTPLCFSLCPDVLLLLATPRSTPHAGPFNAPAWRQGWCSSSSCTRRARRQQQ